MPAHGLSACYIGRVRVRVQSTWRTRVLILIAIVAAGIIAWLEVDRREELRDRTRREERTRAYEVEVELAE